MVLLHDGGHLFGRQVVVHAVIGDVIGEFVIFFHSGGGFFGHFHLLFRGLLAQFLFRFFVTFGTALHVGAVGTLAVSVAVAVIVTLLIMVMLFLIGVIILITSIFFLILVHCKQF